MKNNKQENTFLGGIFLGTLILFWMLMSFGIGLVLSLALAIATHYLVKKKPELIKHKTAIFVVLGILIIISALAPAMKSDKEFRENRDEVIVGESESYDYLTEANTPERDIELVVIKALGHDIEIISLDIESDYISVDYIAEHNISTKLTHRSFLSDTIDVLQNLDSIISEEVNIIRVRPQMMLSDEYGNESLGKVAIIQLNRSAWEKINWENFLTEQLPEIADQYWIHPEFDQE